MLKLLKYSFLMVALTTMLSGSQGFSSFKMAGSAEISSRSGTGQADLSSGFVVNPALNDGKTSISFTHGILLLGSYMNSMTVKTSFSGINTGVSLFYFNSGKIEYIPDQSASNPEGYYSVSDLYMKLNLSKRWGSFSFGISPMFYLENMLEYSGSGYGLDFGVYYKTSTGFRMGASILNWSGRPFTEGASLIAFPFIPPFIVNGGISLAHKLGKAQAKAFIDFSYDMDMKIPSLKVGYTADYKNVEFNFGYRFLDLYEGSPVLLNYTYGPAAGISFSLFNIKLAYSFQYMYGGFNPVHKISITVLNVD